MNKKLSVEICIPAFNEESNIVNILCDIFAQKYNNYFLKRVVIYCDGSTDQTVKVIRMNLNRFPLVEIGDNKERRGKLYRLNQIYKNFDSDILIILDADIRLVGKDFLDVLIQPMINDNKTVMVAAQETPIRPNNFFGRIMYQSFVNWDFVCQNIPHNDSVHSFGGAATAYRRLFAKKLKIPKGVKEERMYLYLSAKKENGYIFNEKAIMLYLPISTLKDFRGLMRRSFGEKDIQLDKMFGFDTSEAMKVPLKYKLKGISKAILHSPLYAPIAIIFNIIIGKFKNRNNIDTNSVWEFSESTKKPLNSNIYQ